MEPRLFRLPSRRTTGAWRCCVALLATACLPARAADPVAMMESQSVLVFGAWVMALLLGIAIGWIWHRAHAQASVTVRDPLAGLESAALTYDANGALVQTNAAASRLLAHNQQDNGAVIPSALVTQVPRALASGQLDATLETKLGNTWIGWTIEPLPDLGIALVHLVDITARKRRDEELQRELAAAREAHRSTGEFVSTLSHDIRVPMNGVLGMANLLLESSLSAPQTELARAVVQSAENVIILTDELLDLAKIEAGKLEISPQPCEISVLLDELLRAQASRAIEKRLDLAGVVDPAVPAVLLVDPVRLRQILANLVNNALKFTERGEVIVRAWVEPGGSELRFSIRDTGIGIAPEKQDQLFQAFTQADASTFRKYGGTGLGLFTCKQLAALMGGRVWFESKIGQGSTFSLSLPLRRATEAAAPAWSQPQVQLQGKTVLLVEDNLAVSHILTEWLGRWGAKVVSFGTADDAVAWVQSGGHCLMAVVDLDLPGTAALNLLGILGQLRSAPRRIAMSARPPSLPGTHVGIDVLLKPINATGLLDCLRRAPKSAGPTRLTVSSGPQTANATGAPVAPHPAPSPHSATPNAPRVLVADDDVVNQKVMRTYIERFGCKVRVVSNGAEALDAIQKERPDLVFLDIMMPVMDGLTAVRELRRREAAAATPDQPLQHLPIVAITAKVMPSDRDAGIAAGFDDYATKPINGARLREAVERFLPGFLSATPDLLASGAVPLAPAPIAPANGAPVSAVAARNVPVLIDRSRLAELASGDPETIREIVALYFQKMDSLLNELSRELELPNQGDARRLAHTGAGSSGTCGMVRTQAAFRLVEHLLEARNDIAARNGMTEIRAALEASRNACNEAFETA